MRGRWLCWTSGTGSTKQGTVSGGRQASFGGFVAFMRLCHGIARRCKDKEHALRGQQHRRYTPQISASPRIITSPRVAAAATAATRGPRTFRSRIYILYGVSREAARRRSWEGTDVDEVGGIYARTGLSAVDVRHCGWVQAAREGRWRRTQAAHHVNRYSASPLPPANPPRPTSPLSHPLRAAF